jgi:tripartite-type tricarboxylate transporter receptor subunit TctC
MIQRRTVLAAAAGSLAAPLLSIPRALMRSSRQRLHRVGLPPGGMGDMVARPLAEKLRGKYAESLLLDSRPGAGGRIAAEYVKRAAPDGKTILQIPGSIMALYPHIYSKLPFDPVADFIPVSTLCTYVYSFTAGPACRQRSRRWPTTSNGRAPTAPRRCTASRPRARLCTSPA